MSEKPPRIADVTICQSVNPKFPECQVPLEQKHCIEVPCFLCDRPMWLHRLQALLILNSDVYAYCSDCYFEAGLAGKLAYEGMMKVRLEAEGEFL